LPYIINHFLTFTVFWGFVGFSAAFLGLGYLGCLGALSRSCGGESDLKKKVAAKASAIKIATTTIYLGWIGNFSIREAYSTGLAGLLLGFSSSYLIIDGGF
jgi:hypothetical protein